MDKSKLALLVLIVLAIFVGIYYFMPSNNPAKVTLVITMLENKDLNKSIDEVVNKLVERISKLEPNELEIKFFNSNIDKAKKNIIIRKPNQNDILWEKEITNLIKSNLISNKQIELSNQSTNDLILQTVKNFEKQTGDAVNLYIIAGAFPDCYDNNSAVELQKKLSGLKLNIKAETQLIWAVLDTRNNEEEVLNSIIKYNLANVIDSRIIFPNSRICEETKLVNVYAAYFDNMNDEQAIEFINYLKSIYGNSIKLKIWNDSELNNKILNLNLKDSISKKYIETLKQIKKCNWTSIGFIFKQSVNEFKQLANSEKKNMIIIGNLPSLGPGSQLDENTWTYWKNDSLLRISFYLPKGKKLNQTDNAIITGLKKYAINYVLIKN